MKQLSSLLHNAARLGNIAQAQGLISRGVDIDTQDKKGLSSLHLAAMYGQNSFAQLLIQHEADIELVSTIGTTPIHVAAQFGNIGIIRLLLMSGAPINVKDNNGCTPLDWAYWGGNMAATQLLISHKAIFSGSTITSHISLHQSATFGHAERARQLIRDDAVMHIYNNEGLTPLHIAAIFGQTEVAIILVEAFGHDGINMPDKRKLLTALHMAAAYGKTKIAQLLINQNANINAQNIHGHTPLHLAIWYGHMEVARLLLLSGAHINMPEPGKARLLESIYHFLGKSSQVELYTQQFAVYLHIHNDTRLLQTYADKMLLGISVCGREAARQTLINWQKTLRDYAALSVTAAGKHASDIHCKNSIIMMLRYVFNVVTYKCFAAPRRLCQGIINAYASLPGSPGWLQNIEVLAVGQRIPVTNSLSATARPTQMTLHNALCFCLELLQNTPAFVRTDIPLHISAKRGYIKIATLLLQKGASTEACSKSLYRPLHIAAMYGQTRLMKLLLTRGAHIEAKNYIDCTPLHVAVQKRYTKAAELLVRAGADINAIDRFGHTPLHYALSNKQAKMIRLLKQAESIMYTLCDTCILPESKRRKIEG